MTDEIREAAETKIYEMACEVEAAYHGKNEFFSHKEALERFDGMVSLAKAIGFDDEEIFAIKRSAAYNWNN